MSASMSVSSNRMRTDLNPRLRCLRKWRIRCAAGEDEREGGDMLSVLMILLDAALPQRVDRPTHYTHRRHYAHRRLARLGLVQLMVPSLYSQRGCGEQAGRRRASRECSVRLARFGMAPGSESDTRRNGRSQVHPGVEHDARIVGVSCPLEVYPAMSADSPARFIAQQAHPFAGRVGNVRGADQECSDQVGGCVRQTRENMGGAECDAWGGIRSTRPRRE
jgi:hypothetical protein